MSASEVRCGSDAENCNDDGCWGRDMPSWAQRHRGAAALTVVRGSHASQAMRLLRMLLSLQ